MLLLTAYRPSHTAAAFYTMTCRIVTRTVIHRSAVYFHVGVVKSHCCCCITTTCACVLLRRPQLPPQQQQRQQQQSIPQQPFGDSSSSSSSGMLQRPSGQLLSPPGRAATAPPKLNDQDTRMAAHDSLVVQVRVMLYRGVGGSGVREGEGGAVTGWRV